MGKLFWIGSGVGLLAAIGLWIVVTWPIQKDVAKLKGQLAKKRDELTSWATPGPGKKQKFDDIVNQSFIDVEKAYKRELDATTGQLLKQMRERNMSFGDEVWKDSPGGAPPMNDVASFREWLTDRYIERDAKLRAKDVVVPDDAIALGNVSNWVDVVEADLPLILRNYRISCEVFSALADASAEVVYDAKVTQKGKMESFKGTEKRRVVGIDGLRFEDESAGSGRRGRSAPVRQKSSLLRNYEFTVSFSAHHGPAIDFIRRLEGSKAGIFIVRTVRLSRNDHIKSLAGDEEESPYGNRIKFEAPAVVNVTASLVEFVDRKGG